MARANNGTPKFSAKKIVDLAPRKKIKINVIQFFFSVYVLNAPTKEGNESE